MENNDDIIALRFSLLSIPENQRTIHQSNALRDCDIALRVVHVEDRVAREAAARCRNHYIPGADAVRSPALARVHKMLKLRLLVLSYTDATVKAELAHEQGASNAKIDKLEAKVKSSYAELMAALEESVGE